jgi:hypothetical protein
VRKHQPELPKLTDYHDVELNVMARIQNLLHQLDEKGRERVLRWCVRRYGEDWGEMGKCEFVHPPPLAQI